MIDITRHWVCVSVVGNAYVHVKSIVYRSVSMFFFFSSRRRHTRLQGDWSSDVCSSDLDREFTETRPPSKAEALAGLDEAVAVYRRVVEGLTPEGLLAAHPDAEKMGSEIGRASCRERV